MKNKSVPHSLCACGKRGFHVERLADKALGRAQAKRTRKADATGTRRGMCAETRYYLCDHSDLYHLTSESRRVFNSYQGVAA